MRLVARGGIGNSRDRLARASSALTLCDEWDSVSLTDLMNSWTRPLALSGGGLPPARGHFGVCHSMLSRVQLSISPIIANIKGASISLVLGGDDPAHPKPSFTHASPDHALLGNLSVSKYQCSYTNSRCTIISSERQTSRQVKCQNPLGFPGLSSHIKAVARRGREKSKSIGFLVPA